MKVGTDGVLLGAWADVAGPERILDIGTGSGVIAIMLAQRRPSAAVHGVEIDAESCEQARENVRISPWADRLSMVCASVQTYEGKEGAYDLIVSNPPFFSGGTFSDNQDRTSIRHTTKLPHGDLLQSARRLLSPAGRFCVVLPLIEGLRFREMATQYQLYCTRFRAVRSKEEKPVERLLLQFERRPKEIVEEPELIIQFDGINDWTPAYRELTGDFYLYM